jgi:hypothetical protein
MNMSAPISFVKKQRPKQSKVFDTYWKFAAKRQEVFFARLEGRPKPWVDDQIINEYKFTNAYRASDRVSQYLIKNVIYSKRWSMADTVFRTLLFKFFNKIETWQLLEHQFDEISIETFNVLNFDRVLENAMRAGGTIYSAAYIIPSGSGERYKGVRKHLFHLLLIDSLMKGDFLKTLKKTKSMEDGYKLLLGIESLGKFLAYQFITDLNYSAHINYSEMEFVVPGPGALDGIKKCFVSMGDYSEADIIRLMADEQELNFERLGYNFKSLWGRPLQLIDCQNLFCEVDKYSRVAHPDVSGISGRTRIKQKFNPNYSHLNVWYPPKWDINQKINALPPTIMMR